jgi:hypothetical protein
MTTNYPKRKDVYYNNTVYKVIVDDLKHINKVDVVKLSNDIVVYWDDNEQKWKRADNELIELYTNKKHIDVEFNGELIKCISNLDLYHNINNQSVTEVNIKCTVLLDKEKNIWRILNKNDDIFNKYN